jgi:hypothetical protein
MDVRVEKSGFLSVRVGMNSEGLAMSGNGLQDDPITMNHHPKRTYSTRRDSIFMTILEKAANVSEAIEIVNDFDFSPMFNAQCHIADAGGDAVVISPGLDGEIAFTRINQSVDDDYLVSTNVNRNYDIDEQDPRFDRVTNMLENGGGTTVASVTSILDVVHWEGFETNTFYSNVFDLPNRMAYFYYFHQYDEVVEFDLMEELAMRDHSYLLEDLFSQNIVDDAKGEYKMYNTIVVIVRIIMVLLSLAIMLLLGYQIFKIIKTENLSALNKSRNITTKTVLSLLGILFILINGAYLNYFVAGNYLISRNSAKVDALFYQFLTFWSIAVVFSITYVVVKKYRSRNH